MPSMRPRHAILIAVALLFAVAHWVPGGRLLLYPLTLFVTWIHEMGHGLAALAVGGSFTQLQILSDGSGLAHAFAAPGWPTAAVSAGGLLGPAVFAAVVLGAVHGPKRARAFLLTLSLFMLLSTVIWIRSATGVIVVPALAVLLGWVGWRGFREAPERRVIVAQVLAVVAAIDTLTRMVSYVFMKQVTVDGQVRLSDIGRFAESVGGWYVLWGVGFTVVACGLLGVGGWLAWRVPEASAVKVRKGSDAVPALGKRPTTRPHP